MILNPPSLLQHAEATDQPSTLEFSELLAALVDEFLSESDVSKKSALLNELATAGTCNSRLQKLFFENRTQMQPSSSEVVAAGLPTFLVQELFGILVATERTRMSELGVDTLEYAVSMLNLLFRMCFDGQLLPERLHFFHETSIEELVLVLTSTIHRKKRDVMKSSVHQQQQIRLVVEELLDTQVALVLELEALQQEANVVDPTFLTRQMKHLPQLLVRSPSFPLWISKLFKRIAISVSRTNVELRDEKPSSWSLTLWRNVKLFDMLWNTPSADLDVLSLLRESRLDYIK